MTWLDTFFNSEFMLNSVKLREPLKLQKHEVNQILDIWKTWQDTETDTVFQFHHTMNWTNEMVEAIGVEQNQSDAESDASGRPLRQTIDQEHQQRRLK
ncbi:hypothetical protein JVU11DRAFT_10606 [Chiua virens]|nr:hypothetical protein JVU11DRAFT_10606 [Chiua virens]